MEVQVKYNDINFTMYIPTLDILESYPGANVQKYILENNVWAEEETSILSKILNKTNGVVIDVGANTGYFSFIALSKGARVYSFEPNTIHTPYFMKTIEINNFPKEKLSHYEKFVSSSKDDVLFDGWSAYDGIVNVNNTQLTKTIALKDVCDECLFLKIDVEGFEPDVIQSATPLLENGKISYIMFEITYIVNNSVDKKQVEMLNLLTKYGYNLFEIVPKKIIRINNISQKVEIWANEYYNHHKKCNPLLTSAGSNIFAIYKTSVNPFNKLNRDEFQIS